MLQINKYLRKKNTNFLNLYYTFIHVQKKTLSPPLRFASKTFTTYFNNNYKLCNESFHLYGNGNIVAIASLKKKTG